MKSAISVSMTICLSIAALFSPAVAQQYNAQFTKCGHPESLATDKIFDVDVYM